MSVVLNEKREQLRFGIGSQGGERQAGVALALFTKIPVGADVTAFLDVPTELNTNIRQQAQGGEVVDPTLAAQGYVFEHAPEPGPVTVGFTTLRGRNRVLVTNGLGQMTPTQLEPAWAPFTVPVTGSLIQRGRRKHSFVMPGGIPADANLKDADRHLLRLRWKGVAVAGQALPPGTGAKQTITQQLKDALARPIGNIAPGSVVVHFNQGAAPQTLRDDGRSRIVGFGATGSGDGVIDYLNGIVTITFFAPGADVGPVTIDFEHSCLYQPIDATLAWIMDESTGSQ